jgi:CBS domain-containing protein
MSLRAAAHLLSQAQVTGAPVVDEQGRCVGVISATDFLRWAEKDKGLATPSKARPACVCSEWQVVEPDDLPREEVRTFMTPDPVVVPPGTAIHRLAQLMIDAHIHRVVVVNRDRQPVGIVSSTDILAAVARAGQGA